MSDQYPRRGPAPRWPDDDPRMSAGGDPRMSAGRDPRAGGGRDPRVPARGRAYDDGPPPGYGWSDGQGTAPAGRRGYDRPDSEWGGYDRPDSEWGGTPYPRVPAGRVTGPIRKPRGNGQRRFWTVVAAVLVFAGLTVAAVVVVRQFSSPAPTGGTTSAKPDASGELTFQRLADPGRTLVRNASGATLASFTDGARTALLAGPKRTFAEPKFTKATVSTDRWIRLAPQEWQPGAERASWFRPWLTKALSDTSPDVFAVAMEYLYNVPPKKDGDGVRYAGDASFGPVSAEDPDGRAENNDFYDYLGVPWTFPDGTTEKPNPDRYGDIDCSGFLRIVYGYRMGYPLRNTNVAGPGLPRRAFAISDLGPGVQIIKNRGKRAREYDRLQPGDLVFFNTDPAIPKEVTHSGIYLGLDNAGHYRFISSRTKADGPTFGDLGGAAILDGGAYFSLRFRSARRL